MGTTKQLVSAGIIGYGKGSDIADGGKSLDSAGHGSHLDAAIGVSKLISGIAAGAAVGGGVQGVAVGLAVPEALEWIGRRTGQNIADATLPDPLKRAPTGSRFPVKRPNSRQGKPNESEPVSTVPRNWLDPLAPKPLPSTPDGDGNSDSHAGEPMGPPAPDQPQIINLPGHEGSVYYIPRGPDGVPYYGDRLPQGPAWDWPPRRGSGSGTRAAAHAAIGP